MNRVFAQLGIRMAAVVLVCMTCSAGVAQQTPSTPVPSPTSPASQAAVDPKQAAQEQALKNRLAVERMGQITDAERQGVDVRIKDIARFRGVRSNQLTGYGLIVGLQGTGDTRNTPFTASLIANALQTITNIDPTQLKLKNVAVVTVTAELPPFASPGNRIDATVQSIGDATSLQGGYLLQTPLKAFNKKVYAVAMGPLSIGGFNVSSNGSSVQKNHSTVGKLPEMATVEESVDTQIVFSGKMFLELNTEDFTTAQRIVDRVAKDHPEYMPMAIDGGTVQLVLPPDKSAVQAMSEIESLHFLSDTPATVVISENTGTVVMGGNVKIGPAVVAKGSITVRIDQDVIISQPNPFSLGKTDQAKVSNVQAQEDTAQVAMMGPTTTVADLAVIFTALKVSAQDMIAILEALHAQGALKAAIKIQ